MERAQVESSNIVSIGYDPGAQTLEIEFLNGSVYQYYSVPEYVYIELMSSDSHGRYFSENVKRIYSCSKV